MPNRLATTCFVFLFCLCQALPAATDVIDINRADAERLAAELPGIGPVKAAAIVAYRAAHGPFRSVDELIEVKGIGPRTLDKLRRRLQVGIESGAVDGRTSRHDPERAARAAVRAAIRLARRDSVAVEGAEGMHTHTQVLHPLSATE